MTFADLADGGGQLAALLTDVPEGTVMVGVPPGGVPVGAAVASALGREVIPLRVTRDDAGVHVALPVDVAGRDVVVVDDGVETGTAAKAVAAALREAGASRVVLAVPVCPREIEAELRGPYDDVIAVERPLVRRSLRWHYDTFA
jgi:predicted phosphoribosyltransferase